MENAKSKKCPFLDEMPIWDIDTKSPQGLIAAQIIELITTCGCLKNRSVFLNEAWGSGKTSIIEYFKEKEKKEENKIKVLKIDAWDAPKTLITWDILKRIADKVLGIEYQSKRLEDENFQRWFAGSHKKKLKHAKSIALVYFTLFAFAPFVAFFINLYSEKAKKHDSLIMFLTQPATIIGSIGVFIIATLIFIACHKFSEILLPFFSGSASQYSEYSEGEDCPPSKADEIAYCILENYKEPYLAVFIDNLDRLEFSAQRNYLDALFIVIDAFFKQEKCPQCKVWFIIAADESKMLDPTNAVPPKNPNAPEPNNPPPSGPSIWQNYADKIAPLQFFLAQPRKLWGLFSAACGVKIEI